MQQVLVVIGDGAEVIDTMVPYYRLSEDYHVVLAAPKRRTYHLVQHEHDPAWDITVESPGYTLASDIAALDRQAPLKPTAETGTRPRNQVRLASRLRYITL